MKNSLTIGGSYEHNGGGHRRQLIYTDPDNGRLRRSNYRNPAYPAHVRLAVRRGADSGYNVGITGLFCQYIVEPTARWIVTAAAGTTGSRWTTRASAGQVTNATFDAFSPKLSATFKAIAPTSETGVAVNLYGTYSEAFLPPRRPSQLTPTTAALDLKPEDISNYEGGVKAGLAGSRLSLEAAVFRHDTRWDRDDGAAGPVLHSVNAGQQRFKGLETGAHWTTARVSLFGNASFYHNRFGDYVIQSSGGDTVLTGNRLPIAPDTVLNAGVTFAAHRTVDLTVDVKRVGEVALDQINTVTLDAYSLVDAAATWRTGRCASRSRRTICSTPTTTGAEIPRSASLRTLGGRGRYGDHVDRGEVARSIALMESLRKAACPISGSVRW